MLTVNLNNNDILQDLHYWYDPVGNITEIQDDAQQTLFFNNSVVSPTQDFTYDALYRLIAAEGRELIGSNSFGVNDNYNDAAWQTTHKGDGNAVQRYTQQYTYDAVGNILELSHNAAAGAYTRTYDIATDSNRLLSTTVGRTSPPGSDTYAYAYDVRGNMETMPHLSSMDWNLDNELSSIAKGTMAAWYQYSGGQRIRKYVDKGSFKEERIYLGSYEIYRKYVSGVIDVERSTVHISDNTGRIAMLEVLNTDYNSDGAADELTRYIYSNHLQSASLELDDTGAIISYEEYHPYGTTSYQAMNASINAVAKRYRYTGKERDEESGLYYHGARYYIPWLCRWTAADPLESDYAGMSPYNYGFNNPVIFNDPSGMEGEEFNRPPPPTADATSTSSVINIFDIISNGLRTPDGGTLNFPKGTQVISVVEEGGDYTWSVSGKSADLPLGAVLRFSFDGIAFSAVFNASDKSFIGYYSEEGYYITHDKNNLPDELQLGRASETLSAGFAFGMVGGSSAIRLTPQGRIIGLGVLSFAAIAAIYEALDNPYDAFVLRRPIVTDVPVAIPIGTSVPVTDRPAPSPDGFGYATYTKTHPLTGEVYVGRTSGYGTAADIVSKRDVNHHMTEKWGYGPAVVTSYLPATIPGGYAFRYEDPSYHAIRASEQFQISAYRMLGLSGNYYQQINGISPFNRNKETYIEAFQRWME